MAKARVGVKTKKIKPSGLTQKQEDILQMLADGYSTKDIAAKTFRAECTICTHITNVFNYLRVNSRIEAVVYGFRKGFLK
ncbi:MAG: LuxR C-terminal-related transcriptional regulator [Candidatus Gastranaerophilales bacterium]|nr:LuxR C-terminal-related transcriptional regulator [Candidatus Gastranaerophilales bacterium]